LLSNKVQNTKDNKLNKNNTDIRKLPTIKPQNSDMEDVDDQNQSKANKEKEDIKPIHMKIA